jgi:hypothetical protein
VNAVTGSALPLTSIPPRASRSKYGSTSRCVSAVICTVPGCAVCSMRAATFTASPIAVYSSRRSEPTCPTITGPVLMPTRTSSSRPRSALIRSLKPAIPATMSSPACTARFGSSSCAIGAPKNAKIASPIRRASVPS